MTATQPAPLAGQAAHVFACGKMVSPDYSLLTALAGQSTHEGSTHDPSKKVTMRRIGPYNPGLSRPFAARVLLLLMASFYAAGAVIAVMFGLGMHPLS